MKEIKLFFLIPCFIVFFTGCTINSEKTVSSESMVQNTSKTDAAEDIDGNFQYT